MEKNYTLANLSEADEKILKKVEREFRCEANKDVYLMAYCKDC